MPTVLQLRRGTTAEHSTFTGAEGEVTVNTSKDTLVVHDGSTQGGFEIALADGSNFTGLDLSSVAQDIIPDGDNTRSLGSSTKQWQDVYVGPGSLYVNGQQVVSDNSGTITVSADANQNVSLQTSGSGDIEIDPTGTGIIQIKGTLQVENGQNITDSTGGTISFGNGIAVDSITSKTADTDLSISGNGTGNVAISDSLSVGGALTVTGDLTVNGTTTTINSTTLTVDDKNIVLASGAADSSAADGAGITVDGASATFSYSHTGTKWTMNKALDITGDLTTSGAFTLDSVVVNAITTSGETFDDSDTTLMTAAAAEDRFRVNIYDTSGSLLN